MYMKLLSIYCVCYSWEMVLNVGLYASVDNGRKQGKLIERTPTCHVTRRSVDTQIIKRRLSDLVVTQPKRLLK
jgi:hypothetical protein